MSDQPDEFQPIDQVVARAKVGGRVVFRLAASGTLPTVKVRSTWRFRNGALDQRVGRRVSTAKVDDVQGAE